MIVLIGVIGILAVLVVALVIWLIISYEKIGAADRKFNLALEDFVVYKRLEGEREKAIRKDAIARSTSVVKGKVAEHMVPFNKTFGFNPRDCRFIGSPIDFVVFDGLTEGDLERVVLVEVKTGKSRLSKRERQVKDAIAYENLVFLTFRVDDEGEGTWSH